MRGPLGNTGKALEWARKARELAPNDARAGLILGQLTYESGNHAWAYSLLQESVRRSNEPKTLHAFAWSAYSLGKVSEARGAMEALLKLASDGSEAADAKTFLAMTALDGNEAALFAAEGEIKNVLQRDGNYVPALMARGMLERNRKNRTASEAALAAVLRRFPEFAPGQKHLALLYADDPQQRSKAYELAKKARRTLTDDPELAEVLARLSYDRKEYAYTAQLLRETEAKRPLRAESLYYLGVSRIQLKDRGQGQEALKKAVTAGLTEPFLSDAKRILAESEAK